MARGLARPQRQDMEHSSTDQRDDRLTLPQSTRMLLKKVDISKRHPGLQLDKLSCVGDMKVQQNALKKVVDPCGDGQLLADLLARRDDTLKSLNAQRLTMATCGSLTLHLSRSGALGNAGIALHPIYGFVYLPGSGIKGLTRAYAETVWAPDQDDPETAWRQIEKVFGWSPGSERHKRGWRPNSVDAQEGAAAGRLVFHDAWPTRWPKLIVDVVNNHHPNYYAGEDDPGAWENPTLVYFLAIDAGNQFEFAISDRVRAANDNLLETACGWLRDALIIEGAGAKTAAGYGRFQPVEGERAPIPKTLTNATYELRLASPAFLAGADQQQEDCDLRPATLRGLLRWWWRTMHAGHLDRKTLKQLETTVWGDAESGSPVRIAVDLKSNEAPIVYDYKDRFNPKPGFKSRNDLQAPPNKKTTQGLFYASYGMDDDRQGGRKRWYRPEGTRWSIRIDARRGRFSPSSGGPAQEIKPEDILGQALASLWLLCRFGGVGSKGRKGFGSFADIEIKGISSPKDCQLRARDFRQICELQSNQGSVDSPDLESMKIREIKTPWSNPWTALDQLGYAAQRFAQKYAHNPKKKALGLPRQIHGPRRDPIGHQKQNPQSHKPPKKLSAGKINRHAAPIHYHLARSKDGKLIIRVTAFPAHRLPNYRESKEMLDDLLEFIDNDLTERTKKNQSIGQDTGPKGESARQRDTAMGAAFETALASKARSLPKPGTRVQAELLKEKTRKGGWKAKHLDSGLQGPIQNTKDVPTDAQQGQRVELTVAYVRSQEMAFKWASRT